MKLPEGTPTDLLQLNILASTLNAPTRDWVFLAFERFALVPSHKLHSQTIYNRVAFF
jgi:hypothetical protein